MLSRILSVAIIAFDIWMVIDAVRRRAEWYWFLIIIFVPFGAIIYFVVVKRHDFNIEGGSVGQTPTRTRPPSLRTARDRYNQTPSRENHILYAQALWADGDYTKAAQEFRSILTTDPENLEGLHGVGVSELAAKNPKEAVGFLQKVVDKQPSYLDYSVWPDLVRALRADGQDSRALETLRHLSRISRRIGHQLLLVETLAELGHREEAKIAADEALRDYEESPAYVQRNDADSARRLKKLRMSL